MRVHVRTKARTALVVALPLLILGTSVFFRAEAQEKKAPRADAHPFVFRDAGKEAGLFPHVARIHGHGAGWGDADGDGWIDLYVATFHTGGGKPNVLPQPQGQVPA